MPVVRSTLHAYLPVIVSADAEGRASFIDRMDVLIGGTHRERPLITLRA